MRAQPDQCFVNQGDGTFVNGAESMGMIDKDGKGLGVAVADFDGNGSPDVYIANDTTANFLYLNQGDGTYQDQALFRGCAVSGEGLFQASMGLAIGDYDRDGLLDIYSTHYYDESNTLYCNRGPAGFQDMTKRVGLHTPTLQALAFGTVMQDFDQDGQHSCFSTMD